MDTNRKRELINIAGMLAPSAIAYGLDGLASFFREYSASTFHVTSALFFVALSPVVRGAIYLALTWLFLIRSPPNWPSSAIYIVSGLLIVFMPVSGYASACPRT
jgi:hypothetical protein